MLDTLTMLVPIDAVDANDVEHLLDVAFGADRHQRTAYRLREGMRADSDLSIAALDSDGRLVGSLQSWPIQLTTPDAVAVPLVLVGPVAVAPSHQRQGLGREMMVRMLAKADDIGAPAAGSDRRPRILWPVLQLSRRRNRRVGIAGSVRASSSARADGRSGSSDRGHAGAAALTFPRAHQLR
jgi:GNAT superfamily N-acetyltransferase